jgi:BlaI family transcriptional regulator, penicillinase repressor
LDEILFTGRELDVMAVLWTHGASTVAEVRARLDVPLAYTTVLTVLRTLEGKGHVSHESDGKAHRYQPRVARDAAGRSALGRIVEKIFGGSRELLLTQLVDGASIDEAELLRLRTVLSERLKDGGGAR